MSLAKRYGILVVEDNEVTQKVMSQFLIAQGFIVKVAGTASEATKAIDGEINLALVDIGLPDFDGQNLVTRLRRYYNKKRLKICFVSSLNEKETIKKSLEIGGDDYLIKPVDHVILLHKITKLLGDSDAKFAWVGIDCAAEIVNSDIMPEMRVLRIGETGVFFRSSALFKIGVHIKVDCPKLTKEIGHPFGEIIHRVTSCEKLKESNYFVGTEFVGISEKLLQPIRSLSIRGKFSHDDPK